MFEAYQAISQSQQTTHEVIDIDTGAVICTLPITDGGRLPKYRAYIKPVKQVKNTTE